MRCIIFTVTYSVFYIANSKPLYSYCISTTTNHNPSYLHSCRSTHCKALVVKIIVFIRPLTKASQT